MQNLVRHTLPKTIRRKSTVLTSGSVEVGSLVLTHQYLSWWAHFFASLQEVAVGGLDMISLPRLPLRQGGCQGKFTYFIRKSEEQSYGQGSPPEIQKNV